MIRTIATIAFVIFLSVCPSAQAEVTFDWAYIGNAGNGADTPPTFTIGGNEFPTRQPNGAVGYNYHISKHEVMNSQYTEFLNAVDPVGTNALNLYDLEMTNNGNGGILFNGGASSGLKYEVKPGRESNPVVFVDFFDAMRFTNWLENGQGSGDTEAGVYTIGTGLDEVRSPNTQYFIPTADEWFKAAYHKNDGVTANYWQHATSTDVAPYSDQAPGSSSPDPSNVVNYYLDDVIDTNGYNDGYAVTGSPLLVEGQNYLTDVGAYDSSTSPYGTFDQAGNVAEWTEDLGFSGRDVRGGRWASDGADAVGSPTFNASASASASSSSRGFRVASAVVPEPSSIVLLTLLVSGFGTVCRRQRDNGVLSF